MATKYFLFKSKIPPPFKMIIRKTGSMARLKKSGRVEIFIKMEDGTETIKKEEGTKVSGTRHSYQLGSMTTLPLDPNVKVEENEGNLKSQLQRCQYAEGK